MTYISNQNIELSESVFKICSSEMNFYQKGNSFYKMYVKTVCFRLQSEDIY